MLWHPECLGEWGDVNSPKAVFHGLLVFMKINVVYITHVVYLTTRDITYFKNKDFLYSSN